MESVTKTTYNGAFAIALHGHIDTANASEVEAAVHRMVEGLKDGFFAGEYPVAFPKIPIVADGEKVILFALRIGEENPRGSERYHKPYMLLKKTLHFAVDGCIMSSTIESTGACMTG